MDPRPADALELLLPDAPPQFWQRAQRVTTFLRLLSDDGRAGGGASIGVSLSRARGELERSAAMRRARVLEELLRHHLYALTGPDSFAYFGELEGGLQQAWSELEDERAECEWIPHVPAPAETIPSVASRLLVALERSCPGDRRVGLWRARLTRAAHGPVAGERAHAEFLTALRARGGSAATSSAAFSGPSSAKGASKSPARGAPSGERGLAPLEAAALAGLVESLLDRAAVRAARARLEEDPTRLHSDARLRRLAAWTRALCGDDAGARGLAAGLPAARARLPRPLAELRARIPERAALFAGSSPAARLEVADDSAAEGRESYADDGPATEPFGELAEPVVVEAPRRAADRLHAAQPSAAETRTLCGAVLFAAFALAGGGRARLAAHAIAPAQAGRFHAWCDEHDGDFGRAFAGSARATPGERLGALGELEIRVDHVGSAGGSPHAPIDPTTVLASARVPVLTRQGDLVGWLHLEFEHHLVPSSEALLELAGRWRERLGSVAAPRVRAIPSTPEGESRRDPSPLGASGRKDPTREFEDPPGPSIAASVLQRFAEGLNLKTSQRRWSAFEVDGTRVTLVAQGGAGFEPAACGASRGSSASVSSGFDPDVDARGEPAGAGRAVARAIATARAVVFGEPDARLSLHREAASGAAVPLALRGRVDGVWLVESRRRRDFGAADVARFEARAAALAPELAAARFRAWHRARFGHDVHVALDGGAGRGFPCAGISSGSSPGVSIDALIALSSSPAPVALCGPAGAGRRMLARRMHFEGPARERELLVLPAEAPEVERLLRGERAATGPGSLVLDGILELPRESQVRLARLVDGAAEAGVRVFLLLETSVARAVESGRLSSELGRVASAIELTLAPLAERRSEIAPLARLFAAACAQRELRPAPRLDDSALACLWRQPWPGNVRELAQWMHRLVLCHPGESLDASALESFGERFGQPVSKRLSSRQPDRRLLLAALETTANAKGSWNKTRAALYLGWDTDTLQSRMEEAGLAAESPAADAGAAPPMCPTSSGDAEPGASARGAARRQR